MLYHPAINYRAKFIVYEGPHSSQSHTVATNEDAKGMVSMADPAPGIGFGCVLLLLLLHFVCLCMIYKDLIRDRMIQRQAKQLERARQDHRITGHTTDGKEPQEQHPKIHE